MQSTGQTSTQAVSLVPTQGSQMTYANFLSLFIIPAVLPGLPARAGAIILWPHETCASGGTVRGARAGLQPSRASAGTPFRADHLRRRSRDAWRRRVGLGRLRGPGLLQLHRLRAFRAPAVPRRSDDVNWHGRSFLGPGRVE